MTTTTPDTTADSRHVKRRRVRAILAGGLVLGVGAAVTLAAWNDSEFAIGNFQAGSFDLVGSTNGTDFDDHATAAGAATLDFSLNPTNLAPDDVVYAPFSIALDTGTTYGADVTITSTPVTGTLENVTYELLQTTTFGCTADTTGTALVPTATDVGTTPGTAAFSLAAPTGQTLAPVNLCFKVTAGAIAQGDTGSATWEFAAESQS
ncbi:SipW-dependent-type signal peptide-containing protein [Arthrobacter sp. CP30]